MNLLRERQDEVEKIYLEEREKLNDNVGLETFMDAIADNVDQNEIAQLFDRENNQQLMERVIETLNISGIQEGSKGGLKSMDSEMLAHEIRMIMLKYYPQSNRLSEALY